MDIPLEVLEIIFLVVLIFIILLFLFNMFGPNKNVKTVCKGKRRKHGLGIGVRNPTVCYLERSESEKEEKQGLLDRIRTSLIGY